MCDFHGKKHKGFLIRIKSSHGEYFAHGCVPRSCTYMCILIDTFLSFILAFQHTSSGHVMLTQNTTPSEFKLLSSLIQICKIISYILTLFSNKINYNKIYDFIKTF
jgi:hypothetical protein